MFARGTGRPGRDSLTARPVTKAPVRTTNYTIRGVFGADAWPASGRAAAAIKRFKEGDTKFPGVTVFARVHELGTGKGFTFWETDDPVAASRYGLAWSDLIDLTVYPVVDDATVAKALA